jgi:hypothetical protein
MILDGISRGRDSMLLLYERKIIKLDLFYVDKIKKRKVPIKYRLSRLNCFNTCVYNRSSYGN